MSIVELISGLAWVRRALPVSAHSSRAKSSHSASMRSESRVSARPRTGAARSRHRGKASRAMRTAEATSAACARGTCAMTRPLAGLSTSNHASRAAPHVRPPRTISIRCGCSTRSPLCLAGGITPPSSTPCLEPNQPNCPLGWLVGQDPLLLFGILHNDF